MKKVLSSVLSAALLLSLCACGMNYSPIKEEPASYDSSYREVSPTYSNVSYSGSAMLAESAGVSGLSSGSVMNYAADYTNGMEEEFRKAGGDIDSDGQDHPEMNPEKIIYTADTTIETTDFEDAVKKIEAMIAEKGGFVESGSMRDSNYYNKSRGRTGNRTADYVIRIPSEAFQEVMSTLTTIGNVPYCYTYTQNVTAQYYDTQSRLEALKIQETRLFELLSVAESVEDILVIEDKLSDVRYNIDRMQSSLNNYDRQVAFSTINLSLEEVAEYTPQIPVQRTFGEKLLDSVQYGLASALEFMQNLLFWLAENLPVLVILGVILFAVIRLLKRLFRKKFDTIRQKKQEKKNQSESAEKKEE